MEFENRKLNRINTAIETSVYDLLNFYRTPIKNPLTTAEKQQQNLWKQTSIITQQILQSPDTAQQWKEKFQAQLIKPDNTAPINKKNKQTQTIPPTRQLHQSNHIQTIKKQHRTQSTTKQKRQVSIKMTNFARI